MRFQTKDCTGRWRMTDMLLAICASSWAANCSDETSAKADML